MTQLESAHYDKWLTAQAKSRHPSAIRALFPLENNPGMISLLAGKPNPQTFPFENITVTLKPVTPDAPHPKLEINAGADLQEALQYTATCGLPRLHKFVRDFQHHVHGRVAVPGEDDFSVTITNGSQDAFTKACAALIEQGDHVLIESPVYTGAIPEMTIAGAQFVEVECDEQGMSAAKLAHVMENWPENKPRPKLVYTVPTGNNPSGASAGKQRKIDILNLARKYDFLILEDDPYYFLTFDGDRVPSYFALEKELGGVRGRVLRLDSMSKVLSSGLRIGWATGPQKIIEAMDLHTSAANLQPNSTSQAIVQALFKHWGIDGLLEHVSRVADFYRVKRDAFEGAAAKYMSDIATWVTPTAGMFLWLKLDCEDSNDVIKERAIKNGVIALPGNVFYPTPRTTPYTRLSYSMASIEDAEEAFRRLRRTVFEPFHSMSRATNIAEFKRWLKESGCEMHAGLDVVHSPESGYKWVAVGDIPSDAEIATVKRDVCITENSCKDAFKSLGLPDLRSDLLIATYLSLHFVSDKLAEGMQSILKHQPYVNVLPAIGETLTTLYWTEDELAYTLSTAVYKATKDREAHWQNDYEEVKRWLEASSVFVFSWDVFKHAFTMITSRAFPSKLIGDVANTPMLVPLWDVGNHKPLARVVWMDTAYTGKDAISVKIPDGARRGDEVFNNYGAKPTNELLLAYGFVSPPEHIDQHDIVPFKLGAGVAVPEHKKNMLRRWKLMDENDTLVTFNLSDGGSLPAGLKFLMRLLADDELSDDGASSIEELDNKASNDFELECDIHAALFDMLQVKLEGASKSLAKAVGDEEDGGVAVRPAVLQMIKKLLVNHIRIISDTKNGVENTLDRLDEEADDVQSHKLLFRGLHAAVYEIEIGGCSKVVKVFYNEGANVFCNASFDNEAAAYTRLQHLAEFSFVEGVVWIKRERLGRCSSLRIPLKYFGDAPAIPAIIMQSFTGTHKRLCDVSGVGAQVREKAVQVLRDIHRQGICHGDINARNVLICEATGDVKLVDYGSSRALTEGKAEKEVEFMKRRFERAVE
ncbi:hypothetical protein E3P99_03437 [Wallemia hederae]|uniref:Protein kinase domain-containing protein n=1 Tax=Wallemia hederae TaxID=1540922 RepID=A0A4T0FI76_9BASI|nr:hypothetical protein E3P99_03437 [Wallemia hederae]